MAGGSVLGSGVTLSLTLAVFSIAGVGTAQDSGDLLSRVDHLVYASPDLDRGIADIEARLGVHATPGGQHPGVGTRNALVALGPATYLEILAPDPGQPAPPEPRTYGVDSVTAPRIAAWFVKGENLERLRSSAAAGGIPYGAIRSGSRKTPDGTLLAWHFTDPRVPVADNIVPFVIDWGTSPHPARTAAKGARLVGLRAEHPDAPRVQAMLRRLHVDLPIASGPRPLFIAVIDSPRGRVELRSDQ
jgi:hypothetical protein